MTQEEYLEIYQAQQNKLKEKPSKAFELSDAEKDLLEKASIFANGEIVDLGAKNIDDIYDLLDAIFDMLDKVKDKKKLKDLLILLEALNAVVEEDNFEKLEKLKTKKVKAENKKQKDKIDEDPIKQKAKDYGAWAKSKLFTNKRSSDENLGPRLVETKQFDGLTRTQLLEYYKPSKFYLLSNHQKHSLFQATVNEYLASNGIPTCAVEFFPMPITDKSVYYGLYRPQYGEIYINSNLFNNIDNLSDEGNTYFPYQILSTLIHEATHHIQFTSLEHGANDDKNRLIRRSMMNNQDNMSFEEYLTEPDELDARNSALQYIREASYEAKHGKQNLMAFYNIQKNHEIKNPKKPVSKKIQSFFSDIYDNTFLSPTVERSSSMASNARQMSEIIHGRYISQNLQRRKRF